ncbi:hypothetical protein F5887DRAFT_916525 [Amanita rubescens]|nr:hypothetical protein F5887DRAFT_916525 [Amanita rubescens]
MRLSAFIPLFLIFNTVCGSHHNHDHSTLSKRLKHAPSLYDGLEGSEPQVELVGPPGEAEEPPSHPPIGLSLDTLLDHARRDRISDSAVRQACTVRLSNRRLVGDENDEAYLIRPSNAIRKGKVTPLVRRIVVRNPRANPSKLLRVFRKIYVHQHFNTLVGWFKTETSGEKTYYIVISYGVGVLPVSPGDAQDSEVPLGRRRQNYVDQCRDEHRISVSNNERNYVYQRLGPRQYDAIYA